MVVEGDKDDNSMRSLPHFATSVTDGCCCSPSPSFLPPMAGHFSLLVSSFILSIVLLFPFGLLHQEISWACYLNPHTPSSRKNLDSYEDNATVVLSIGDVSFSEKIMRSSHALS
mmetsp:Transcript_47154/g.71302  ORF Transcript_47154/g.71302 Transcript_47154/m.71302 type:complete len:114 (-) Transcript_47154:340-681(-)